jgi:hypothetical protein
MTTRKILFTVLGAFIVLSIFMWFLSNSLTPA